jgi:FkbM family methyltransferase
MAAKFAVMSTDVFVGASFRSGQWWEDHLIAQILAEFGKHPSKNCNILDLGVNLGAHTVAYGMYLLKQGSRYTERCTVFGFEPQPGVFLAAITNVGLNGLGNVQLFNAATVHADGQSVTMGAKEDTGATISFTDSSRPINFGGLSLGSGGVIAKGLKIDSLGFERVGLIKADIQGSEPMAFYGARELIKRDKPLIFYETGFANPRQMQDIIDAIKPGPVPAEASSFDLWTFCQNLGYTMKTFGQDRLLVPPK